MHPIFHFVIIILSGFSAAFALQMIVFLLSNKHL
jgi:hypothetical protein